MRQIVKDLLTEDEIKGKLKARILIILDMIYENPKYIEEYMQEYIKDTPKLIETKTIDQLITRLIKLSCIEGMIIMAKVYKKK